VTRRNSPLLYMACAALCACSNKDDADGGDFQTNSTLTVKSYVNGQLNALSSSVEALQKAAPAPEDNGWNADDHKDAVQSMKDLWYKARTQYEHIEGSIAVLFPELDVSTDERYDAFIETGADEDLFDDQGVTGVHAIERILWSDSIADRVVKFESALQGYKAAAFPQTKDEADEFKNKLCARLVTDVHKMRDDYAAGVTLDAPAAFRGMVGSMTEQSEKTTKAASGEDESRYAQNTLADMRANLDGARAVFNAFRPWIESVEDKPKAQTIESGLEEINTAYTAVDGRALPEVPEGFNPDHPTDDDLATPYGKLWKLLNGKTDLEDKDSLVSDMLKSADAMGLQDFPDN
jgi:iron uptake system component EfeO